MAGRPPTPIGTYGKIKHRELAESVWEAILHAGHEFQIVPFGLRALELMGGRL